jgi:hypothetical protein
MSISLWSACVFGMGIGIAVSFVGMLALHWLVSRTKERDEHRYVPKPGGYTPD